MAEANAVIKVAMGWSNIVPAARVKLAAPGIINVIIGINPAVKRNAVHTWFFLAYVLNHA